MKALTYYVHLLQVVFIGLKLIGEVDWTWLQVFMPYIITFSIWLIGFIYFELLKKGHK
jgi:hypothetical protein